jgi:hypothetical protein
MFGKWEMELKSPPLHKKKRMRKKLLKKRLGVLQYDLVMRLIKGIGENE